MISGALVLVNIFPHAFRVYEGKIHPVPTSWSLWSLIGLALLLTYKSSGAGANVWPAIFGFTNPLLVMILAIRRREHWKKPELYEWACLIFGIISLVLWVFVRNNKQLSTYALVLAIVADLFAAIPTLIFFVKKPMEDRPFAWGMYAFGYFLAIFAMPEQTFANYVLPLYMTVGSGIATLLLAIPRIRRGVPLKEWI
jgi:Na+/melibiose symporter-like transporter